MQTAWAIYCPAFWPRCQIQPTHSSISLAEVTGIAARRVGVVVGVIFVVLAFFPKAAALLIAIPLPVTAAFVTVLVVLLFVQGMRIVIQDGIDHRKATVIGLSFWIGTGVQGKWIFPELLGEGFLGVLLSNGMTAGAIVAILLMVFLEITRPRRKRLQVALESGALPKIEQFLLGFASKGGWNDTSAERLTSAGEETLAILLQESGGAEAADAARRLTINARMEGGSAELEFVTSLEGENVEDHLAYLNELPPVPDEREVSFRLALALCLCRTPPEVSRARHNHSARRGLALEVCARYAHLVPLSVFGDIIPVSLA